MHIPVLWLSGGISDGNEVPIGKEGGFKRTESFHPLQLLGYFPAIPDLDGRGSLIFISVLRALILYCITSFQAAKILFHEGQEFKVHFLPIPWLNTFSSWSIYRISLHLGLGTKCECVICEVTAVIVSTSPSYNHSRDDGDDN